MRALSIGLMMIIFFILSCKKSETMTHEVFRYQYVGSVFALRNGLPWSAKVTCGYFEAQNKYVLRLHTFSSDGFLREALGFGNLPYNVISDTLALQTFDSSTQQPTTSGLFTAYSRYYADGDATSGLYNMLQKPNRFSITEYRAATNDISGSFEVGFFLAAPTIGGGTFHDTAVFTQGTFSTKIQRYIVNRE